MKHLIAQKSSWVAALALLCAWSNPAQAQSDDFGLTESEVEIMTGFGELIEFIPEFELLETAMAVLQGDIGALTNLLDDELLADIAGYGLAVDALLKWSDSVGHV